MDRNTELNIVASLAIQSWTKWTMGEVNGKKFMTKIVKLEKVLLREWYIEEQLSLVFQEILNYREEMIIKV
jgi:hypothetical protein